MKDFEFIKIFVWVSCYGSLRGIGNLIFFVRLKFDFLL